MRFVSSVYVYVNNNKTYAHQLELIAFLEGYMSRESSHSVQILS